MHGETIKIITVYSENDTKHVKVRSVESEHILRQIRSHRAYSIRNTLWHYNRTCPRV